MSQNQGSSKNTGSFLAALQNFLASLLGSKPPTSQPPQPPLPPMPTDEPLVPLTPRVLVIVYNPMVDALKNLRLVEWGMKNRGWKSIDELLAGYIGDVDECSGGVVKYNVVQRIDVDEFPVKVDGFRYTALEYLDMYTNHPDKYHQPDRIDYYKVISDFKLNERVDRNEIDEVWLFTFPFSGTYESIMCGTGAFFCNSSPLENTPGRRYVIMGFSYERGVGEMEEDLGHRAESLLGRIFGCEDFVGWTYAWDRSKQPYAKLDPNKYDAVHYAATNLFAKFLLFDRIAPNNAHCGNVHYAPNSDSDYNWGNSRPVPTAADDWLNFPNLTGAQKTQNASAWGNGDIRGHHRWWFQRIPHVAGRTNGIRNNWWAYICDVTNPEFDAIASTSSGMHVG